MADRFDRFTERARSALVLAQEESVNRRLNVIATEHLLLGLAQLDGCIAAQVLDSLGAPIRTLRGEVEWAIREPPEELGEIGLTAEGKRAVELAVEETRSMMDQHVGTEHILLGLIREKRGRAARVLEGLGITLERARVEVARFQGKPLTVSALRSAAPLPRPLIDDEQKQDEALDLVDGLISAIDRLLDDPDADVGEDAATFLNGVARYGLLHLRTVLETEVTPAAKPFLAAEAVEVVRTVTRERRTAEDLVLPAALGFSTTLQFLATYDEAIQGLDQIVQAVVTQLGAG